MAEAEAADLVLPSQPISISSMPQRFSDVRL
jgi:hypothetical protein